MLASAVVNLKKVSKTTNPINLAQPALFVAKRAIFTENAGTIPPDHPLYMLLTTHKDIGDAGYTLQGAITTPRYPTDQVMLLLLSQMITKYPMMFQIVAMCHQYTIHHQELHLVLLNARQLLGTFQKTEIGRTQTLKPT